MGRNREVVVHRVLYVEEDHPWDPSQGLEGVLPPLLVQHLGESFALQTKSETRMVKVRGWTTQSFIAQARVSPLCSPAQALGCCLWMNHLHSNKELTEERNTQTYADLRNAAMYLLNLRAGFWDAEILVEVRSQEEANSPELQEEVAVFWTLDHLVLGIGNLRGWKWQTSKNI